MAQAGIYDLRIHHDEILLPPLRYWNLFDLQGLRPEAEQARERLAAHWLRPIGWRVGSRPNEPPPPPTRRVQPAEHEHHQPAGRSTGQPPCGDIPRRSASTGRWLNATAAMPGVTAGMSALAGRGRVVNRPKGRIDGVWADTLLQAPAAAPNG